MRITVPAGILLLLVSAAAYGRGEPACVANAREAYAPWAFFGYACDGRCRAHKAGFAWAERNGIGNPAACAGRDGGFMEGCRAYAEYAVTAEQAGFEWARENEVANACDCGGAGDAFRAGCEAYLQAVGE
jgi:hypothetical protein